MLDGYDYLVKQGWEGKGSALRPGGLRRPIIVSQKKTLAGVGEGRDEAFPFWEHIFNVSVNAVKIKVSSDSATDSDAEEKKVFNRLHMLLNTQLDQRCRIPQTLRRASNELRLVPYHIYDLFMVHQLMKKLEFPPYSIHPHPHVCHC